MMTVLLGAIGVLGAILFAIIVRQGSDEFKAWTPRLTSRILELAVSKLPEGKRARMREEWAGRIEDTPGEVGKWVEAFRHLFAARSISRTSIKRDANKPTVLIDGSVLANPEFQYDHVFPKSIADNREDFVIRSKDQIFVFQAKRFRNTREVNEDFDERLK